MAVHHIPKGYAPLTPYLIVDDGAAALEYYKNVFGAIELMRMAMSGGKLGHAEFTIDGCRVMMADEFPDVGAVSPKTVGGTPVSLSLYVEDCDEVFERAISAGATPIRPPEDQFYGDRAGVLKDPFGHQWTVATHVEDVSEEEMERRLAAMDTTLGEPS
ncbi:MAG: VOC family protein [Bryobacterales bacterium]|nr:VOC family protein [Bryobacterales bacterium]